MHSYDEYFKNNSPPDKPFCLIFLACLFHVIPGPPEISYDIMIRIHIMIKIPIHFHQCTINLPPNPRCCFIVSDCCCIYSITQEYWLCWLTSLGTGHGSCRWKKNLSRSWWEGVPLRFLESPKKSEDSSFMTPHLNSLYWIPKLGGYSLSVCLFACLPA